MSYKTAGILRIVLIITALLFLWLSRFAADETDRLEVVFMLIALALAIGLGVITRKFYRCPHCRELLPLRYYSSVGKYCRHCGGKLS